ncbi:MAG: hypothetical protein QOK24_2783 [Verrucomicrobiota bacterium]|jgi:ABC-type transporter MlaC component
MKRILLSLFLGIFVCSSTVEAQQRKGPRTKTKTAAANASADIKDIRDCPDEGRGGDPNLNKRKNIRSDNKKATLQTMQWLKNLRIPVAIARGLPTPIVTPTEQSRNDD